MATETVTPSDKELLEHSRPHYTAFMEWKVSEIALLTDLSPAARDAVKLAFLAGFNRGIDYGRTLHARHDG